MEGIKLAPIPWMRCGASSPPSRTGEEAGSKLRKAQELNKELVEAAAEYDDALMELYFEKGTLTQDDIRQLQMAKGASPAEPDKPADRYGSINDVFESHDALE